MRTDKERIALLEEKLERLEQAIEIVAGLPINMLRVITDRLVDERELTSEWRREMWTDIGDELRQIGGACEPVRYAARIIPHEIPPYQRSADARVRKPLLRPKKENPPG